MSSGLDWDRLRDYVRRDMTTAGYPRQEDFADALPQFSLRALSDFLTGKSHPRMSTLAKFEIALGWAPGSAKDVMRGAEPRRLAGGSASVSLSATLPPAGVVVVVRDVSFDELMRMQAAVTEVFGAATGEEFLRRALQLRAT